MPVRRRFLHPIWLLVSLPGRLGWRLLRALGIGSLGVALGVAALLAACVIIPLSVGARSMKDREFADRIAWVGLIAMGFLSSLFIVSLLRDVFLLIAHLLLSTEHAASLSRLSARWAVALTVLSTLTGLVIARRPRLVEVDIPVTHLPSALHGFSIAQISDVHVGPTIKRGFVDRIVARVDDVNADVIAVTGDLVDG